MNRAELTKEHLAGNALLAYAGILLVIQSWQERDATIELPFNVTISFYEPPPNLLYWIVGVTLLGLTTSFLLAIRWSWIRSYVLDKLADYYSLILGLVTLAAFFVGWVTAVQKLPLEQPWSLVVSWVGIGLMAFIVCRIVSTVFRIVRRASRVRGQWCQWPNFFCCLRGLNHDKISTCFNSWWTIPKAVIVLYIVLGIAIWIGDRIPFLAERNWVTVLSNDKPELLAFTAANLFVVSIVTRLQKDTTLSPTISSFALISGTVIGYVAAFEFLAPYASWVVILCFAIPLLILIFSGKSKQKTQALSE